RIPTSVRFLDEVRGIDHAWVHVANGDLAAGRAAALGAADDTAARGDLVFTVLGLHSALRMGERGLAGRLNALVDRVDGDWVELFARHAAAVDADDGDELDRIAAA